MIVQGGCEGRVCLAVRGLSTTKAQVEFDVRVGRLRPERFARCPLDATPGSYWLDGAPAQSHCSMKEQSGADYAYFNAARNFLARDASSS